MNVTRLATSLKGKLIGDRWKVTKMLPAPATGGNFSFQYEVEDTDGKPYFLKAINLFDLFNALQDTKVLSEQLDWFSHEMEILEKCGNRKMRNVVHAVDSGVHKEPGEFISVPYIVFDKADGDLRTHPCMLDANLATRIYLFKEAVKGARQLHGEKIAHQDIKPSNVVVFPELRGKLADLGRATTPISNQWKEEAHQGDPGYEPIELKYSHFEADWRDRRIAADLYMLGDLFCYVCFGFSFLGACLNRLNPEHTPELWGGTYEEVLPYVRHAHSQVLSHVSTDAEDELGERAAALLDCLCNPEPKRRGHSKNPAKSRYDLERVVTELDIMYHIVKFRKCS